jgi:excisionase family DNA binding protein
MSATAFSDDQPGAGDRPVGSVGRLLDAHEVAAMLGVPVSWVYAQTRAGRIPTVPLGRYYRYRRDAIDAWISDLEAEHGARR